MNTLWTTQCWRVKTMSKNLADVPFDQLMISWTSGNDDSAWSDPWPDLGRWSPHCWSGGKRQSRGWNKQDPLGPWCLTIFLHSLCVCVYIYKYLQCMQVDRSRCKSMQVVLVVTKTCDDVRCATIRRGVFDCHFYSWKAPRNQQQQGIPRRLSATTEIETELELCNIICWAPWFAGLSLLIHGFNSFSSLFNIFFNMFHKKIQLLCLLCRQHVPTSQEMVLLLLGPLLALQNRIRMCCVLVFFGPCPGSDCQVGGHGRRFCRYLLKRPNWRTTKFFFCAHFCLWDMTDMIKYDQIWCIWSYLDIQQD